MKNLPASIRARLLNEARIQNIDFNRLAIIYFQERFLARLARSKYADNFVLKGGLFLYSRYGSFARHTRDIDFLGRNVPNKLEEILAIVHSILDTKIEDGIVFDQTSLTGSRIKEGADYEGIRLSLTGSLDTMRQTIQIDIGFGDVTDPLPQKFDFPNLLPDLSSPQIFAYSIETVVAEKFHAMTLLGPNNSRAKDFYDIWLASMSEKFSAEILQNAIQQTFARRQTPVETGLKLFSLEFSRGAFVTQSWKGFRKTNQRLEAPESFEQIMGEIQKMLEPIVKNNAEGFWNPDARSWE